MKLYEIASALRLLTDQMEDRELADTIDLAAELNKLEIPLEEKVRSIIGLIREREAEQAAFAAEAKRLSERARAKDSSAKWLKDYLCDCLTLAGRSGMTTPIGSVNVLKAARPSISWKGDLDSIPPGLVRIKKELDGTAAYESWKAGKLPDGFEVKHSTFVRIY